ncbi:MAG: rhodanese-like domain-containing protein [Candidatus Brocadia sp.]|uniref:Rhodanese domain-containing protein n=1 Tax=Candidatus Brocadia fulgida TaxID=380242 RepID=A0A0M2UU97_9BACT|nr:MAG: hypothetical protein BROFUL_01869 [Candidatus Brocadia fulgida]MCC6326682.1 rhodanese-like domain-containing protein [Candidatus Brocadia sp.]MCE7911903.1 rhodanese-like domain-containing protein [Candidatus Brocadia sp. AMX3]MBV6519158.1 Thiosulfate sulfurtransferase GlpE [Candidatus Brocadia fulgida]MDG5997666.1 rhodanese-like domain-containing protein [Candidatus Brocadia sp.]
MSMPRKSRGISVVMRFTAVLIFITSASVTFNFNRCCAAETGAQTQTTVRNISPGQAREILEKSQDAYILDVRTKEEYNESHLKGANLIPIQELEQNISKIPKDKIIVVHCASGKRSAKACAMLKDKGLKELCNVEGGIKQWKAEGLPVEKSE